MSSFFSQFSFYKTTNELDMYLFFFILQKIRHAYVVLMYLKTIMKRPRLT